MKNKILVFLFSIVALLCTAWYYNHANDGFTFGGIFSDNSVASHSSQDQSVEEERLLTSVFNQTFTYLGRGGQFYAFVSEDGLHVLKFFRYKRFRHEPWLDYFDFIPFIDAYRLERIEKKRQKLNKVINSCEVAFNFLKQSSGLEYIHFTKTKNLNKSVKIIDKRGNSYFVDLDDMEFIVQRKAQLLGPYIDELMVLKDTKAAKNLLSNIIKMINTESLQGVVDKDPAFMQNTGVFDGQPFHIDIGQIALDTKMAMPERSREEVVSKTFKLNRWLKTKYPELSQHLESEWELVGRG